jgi:hypothetical protein
LLHANSLSETGTSTALLEYTKGLIAKKYQVSIGYDVNAIDNHEETIKILQKYADLYPYSDFSQLSNVARRKFDLGYFLKGGVIDGKSFRQIPSVVHAVFKHYEPHGDAYLYISEWLRDEMESFRRNMGLMARTKMVIKGGNIIHDKQLDYVPHCVELPSADQDMRADWSIPEDATIGIRIGGLEKFDIEWVQDTVVKSLDFDKNLFFVFVNTNPFVYHPRIKYLPAVVDLQSKVNALSSANFFLHGRRMGESFGMAILEAMRCKIPVLAWAGGNDLHHTRLLTSNGLYSNRDDLLSKILGIEKYPDVERNYVKSLEFNRNQVVDKFESKFIKPFL